MQQEMARGRPGCCRAAVSRAGGPRRAPGRHRLPHSAGCAIGRSRATTSPGKLIGPLAGRCPLRPSNWRPVGRRPDGGIRRRETAEVGRGAGESSGEGDDTPPRSISSTSCPCCVCYRSVYLSRAVFFFFRRGRWQGAASLTGLYLVFYLRERPTPPLYPLPPSRPPRGATHRPPADDIG